MHCSGPIECPSSEHMEMKTGKQQNLTKIGFGQKEQDYVDSDIL